MRLVKAEVGYQLLDCKYSASRRKLKIIDIAAGIREC
jgi:hypothetical protein